MEKIFAVSLKAVLPFEEEKLHNALLKYSAIIIIILGEFSLVFAQYYYGPESVVYDYTYNRYLVANYQTGTVVQVDSDGNPESFIVGQGHCLGMCIVDDILYVSCNYWLRGFDLVTLDTVMNLEFPLSGHLDGMTADGNGYLYVIDTGGYLVRVNLETQDVIRYMYLNLPGWPQDCVYDHQNNRIIVATWATSAPIRAIDLADSSMYDVLAYSVGQWDGITIDDEGNFYLASHANLGCIFKYDNAFAEDPELISRGHAEPAGLNYNNRHDVLAVPNYGGNSVDFIEMATMIGDHNCEMSNEINLTYNFPNPFNSTTTIKYSLAKSEHVRIEIYNISGQKLETLYADFQKAGDHLLNWNANDYSSGIYFCRINRAETKNLIRMIYLK